MTHSLLSWIDQHWPEFAITNQIITAHTQPLRELLNAWGLQSKLGDFLDGMTIHTEKAALIDDLQSRDPTDFIFAPLWRITMPRDGIVMPDISFFASNQSNDLCLVTIQSKVTKTKLDNKGLDGAIQSTSTSHYAQMLISTLLATVHSLNCFFL
jgi:hypothetical protein